MSFDVLQEKIIAKQNPTVAGLDARIEYVPEHIRNTHSNGLILPVDAAKQFQRRPGGQAHALRISLLGGKCFQPGNGLLVRLHDYFPPAFMVSENRF